MITLIAESKSMTDARHPVSPDELTRHLPQFADRADEIMKSLSGRSIPQLSSDLNLGPKVAENLYHRIYEFPNKSTGTPAIEAFNGVVFRSLGYDTLSPQAKEMTQSKVMIASSLYGLLKPTDIIKSYRLDFDMKIATGDTALSTYWKRYNTLSLINRMKESGDTELLNLLPMDASKCFDWKLIKNFSKVFVANFKRQDGLELKTPNSTRLKELRGQLLRQILVSGINSAAQLRAIESDDFVYDSDTPYPGHLLFLTD